MSVCCECCVLSGRGLCDGLITRPEESYWLWCVVLCDLETVWMWRPWPTGGLLRPKKKGFIVFYEGHFGTYLFIFMWRFSLTRAMASPLTRFLDHNHTHTTLGRTPLDEWSARQRDLSLTTHSTHKKQTSMLSASFEPTISAGEWPQRDASDRVATGTGSTQSITTCKCSSVQDLHYLKKQIIFVSSSDNMSLTHDSMARPEVAGGKTTSRFAG